MNKIKDFIMKKMGLYFWFWCDWLQILRIRKLNCITFTLINFVFEWDKVDNSFDIEIGLLGFNIGCNMNIDFLIGETEQEKELRKRLEEIKDE